MKYQKKELILINPKIRININTIEDVSQFKK